MTSSEENGPIKSKAAFKRFVRGVDTSGVDWAMIGLATWAEDDDHNFTLVDVQPLASFRTEDSPGTMAALVDVIRRFDADTVPLSGTHDLDFYIDELVNNIFAWIHPRDYNEHSNVELLNRMLQTEQVPSPIPYHSKDFVVVFDDLAAPVRDRGQAILRLLARSKGWVPLDCPWDLFEAGMFKDNALKLKVVNTSMGPVLGSLWEKVRVQMLLEKGFAPSVISCDWFQRLWDYYIPEDVRFCVGAEARLGAVVGHEAGDPDDRSVVMMSAGFLNYSSAAVGGNMVEGRVSTKSTLWQGAKLGGGGSTMGTLEGIDQPIDVGPNSLVGAVANAGVPVGANSVVAAGMAPQLGQRFSPVGDDEFVAYILSLRDPEGDYDPNDDGYVYGRDLAGVPNLQFALAPTAGVVRLYGKERVANDDLY